MAAIFILDSEFNLLLQRQYQYDLDVHAIVQGFKAAVLNSHPFDSPVLTNKGITYIHLKKHEVIFMIPAFSDINLILYMTYLDKFSELLTKYFLHYKMIKTPLITADLVKDNFILIYELFDECMDFGIPQLTEFSILKDYIKTMIKPEDYLDASHVTEEIDLMEKQVETEINSSISRTATTKVSWRPKGIFYNKNEFFINFEENLKFKYNHKIHKVVRNEIIGDIKCKSYLSGMPNLKLGLNETFEDGKSIFNNIQYHQCVDLNKISGKTIQFVPPDGEFDLLNYQIIDTNVLQPPILVKPIYRIYSRNGNYKLRIKVEMITTFKRKFSMSDVHIRIPLIIRHPVLYIDFNKPMKFKTKLGAVIHSLDDECIVWNVEKIQGTMRGEMMAEFDLLQEKLLITKYHENKDRGRQERNDLFYFELGSEFDKVGKGLISTNKRNNKNYIENDRVVLVEFTLRNMLYSGLKVNFLTIKEDQLKMQSFPWIMYSVQCKNDDYSFVLGEDGFTDDIDPEENKKLKENGKWTGDMPSDENQDKGPIDEEPHFDFSTALDHGPVDIEPGFDEYME